MTTLTEWIAEQRAIAHARQDVPALVTALREAWAREDEAIEHDRSVDGGA